MTERSFRFASPNGLLDCVTTLRMPLAVCVLVLLVQGPTWAQDKPDFSGTWLLVNQTLTPASTAQKLIVHQTFTRQSVRGIPIDPPLITIATERQSADGVHSERYTIGEIGGT